MIMLVAMMFAGTMGMLMLVFMRVVVVVIMIMAVTMRVLMVFRTDAHRVFPGQSASAFFTHQSISSEATSISRPARISPLRVWHSGHSANISSA